MKLTVFGATGGTGKNVVERALAAGHEVVAVARRPQAVKPALRLTVLQGDVLDSASIAGAFDGADAVISCIGPTKNLAPGTLISEGVQNIIAGCQSAHVQRLVFQSGILQSDGAELSLLGRLLVRVFRSIFYKAYADKVIAEAALQASELDWVIVRPPALNHTPALGKYVAAPRARVSPISVLSHADCADCLIRAATEPQWVRQIINIGR